MRKLGRNQLTALDFMHRSASKEWGTMLGIGWVLGTHSQTDRVLSSLAKRGFVDRVGDGFNGYGHYRLSDAGAALIAGDDNG